MAQEYQEDSTVDSSEPTTEPGRLTKPRAWADLALVVLVLVLPGLNALTYDLEAFTADRSFTTDMIGLSIQSLAVVAVCAYIVGHSGLSWNWHGFVRFRPLRDTALALVILVFHFVSWWIISDVYYLTVGNHQSLTTEDFMFPVFSGGWQWPLMLVAYLLNSFSEEGAIRVIAVTRLQAIAKSPIAAILVANFLFASYHLYQGWLSAIGVFVFGIFLSLVFSWTKSIWPIVLGHTLSNVVITAIS